MQTNTETRQTIPSWGPSGRICLLLGVAMSLTKKRLIIFTTMGVLALSQTKRILLQPKFAGGNRDGQRLVFNGIRRIFLNFAGPFLEGPPGCEAFPVSLIRCPLFLAISVLSILFIILNTQHDAYGFPALIDY